MQYLYIFFIVISFMGIIFGLRFYVIIFHYYRGNKKKRLKANEIVQKFYDSFDANNLPCVTIQLPVYNEAAVIKRLMRSAAEIDYPKDKLEIQVVDDSTDETVGIIDNYIEELKSEKQVNIYAVRRNNREHYKAGALANALKAAKGEYIAIFDADFIIPEHFLKRTIPQIHNKPGIACVQSRWGHLNKNENWLTRVQSIGIDAYTLYLSSKYYTGLCIHFMGTAGIWKAEAIEKAGGWSGDTLVEDQDLSFRAQMAGYKIIYDVDLVSNAEIPNGINAFKTQQKRWGKGTAQLGIKLTIPLFKSKNLNLRQKLDTFCHFTTNLHSVLCIVSLLLLLPLLLNISNHSNNFSILSILWTVIAFFACLSPCCYYISGGIITKNGLYAAKHILNTILMYSGITVTYSLAVVEAVIGRKSAFVRTPKTGSSDSAIKFSKYSLDGNIYVALIELAMGLYSLFVFILMFFVNAQYFFGFFLGLYALGLMIFGVDSLIKIWSCHKSK